VSNIKREKLLRISGISGVSNLDPGIAKRKRIRLVSRLGARYPLNDIKTAIFPGIGKGTFLVLLVEFEDTTACFSVLGRKGKRAEDVADEAADQVEDFFVDPFLPDQLLIPLSIANGVSQIATSKITSHLVTNAKIIRKFLPIQIEIEGRLGHPGLLRVDSNL
jgi:RNA 3'-terminal phosphate cyclase (ATP)